MEQRLGGAEKPRDTKNLRTDERTGAATLLVDAPNVCQPPPLYEVGLEGYDAGAHLRPCLRIYLLSIWVQKK